VHERLLDMAENDKAIIISHKETELRYKVQPRDTEFSDDKF